MDTKIRKFNGVWISRDMYLSKEITWNEKALLLEIGSLYSCTGCVENNEYFAEFLGIPVTNVGKMITRLEDLGFIVIIHTNGKRNLQFGSMIEDSINVETPTNPNLINSPPCDIVDDGEFEIGVDEEIDSGTKSKKSSKRSKSAGSEIKIPVEKLGSINDVFDFWNSFKKSSGWKYHLNLSYDMKVAILDALNDYSVEDICSAISNFHTALMGEEYFWSCAWSLATFLSKRDWNGKRAPKKWWRFLSNNFILDNYAISYVNKKPEQVQSTDKYPQITEKMVTMYSNLIESPEYKPNFSQLEKFIEASEKMVDFFSTKEIRSENWIKYLSTCLRKNYISRGDAIHPGNLSNQTTWDILMPQLISELGIG